MGLFGFFSGPQTKAEWDKEIIRLQNNLANAQSQLASVKAHDHSSNRPANLVFCQSVIARIKADIANAKTQRKSAPAK